MEEGDQKAHEQHKKGKTDFVAPSQGFEDPQPR
jgi:hypothetical protein